MGHSYRELFPKEAKEQEDLINRRLYLFEQMNNIPLSELIVEELVTFIEIKHKFEITSYDLDQIEGIINKVKNKNKENL